MVASSRRIKIRLEGVRKTYATEQGPPVEVLRGVDADIYDQEFVSLIGPSGCGKTTLLNLIAGLIPHSGGRILVGDQPITGPGRDRGVVFQQDAILPWRTVIRNVEYGLELRGEEPAKRREVALSFLRMVNLEKFADFYPKELSGGMKKRVALAAVFANNPEVLLMDEPFGSLDYPTKLSLQRELMNTWEREKKTTIFVTHDLEEALVLSDRVIALSQGVVESIFEIPFPRPRNDDLRVSADFQEMKKVLWKYLD